LASRESCFCAVHFSQQGRRCFLELWLSQVGRNYPLPRVMLYWFASFLFSVFLTCRSSLPSTIPPPLAAAPILLRRRRPSSGGGGAPSLRCPSSLLLSSHRRSSFPRAGPPWVEAGRAREFPGLGPRATRDEGEGRRSKGMARASRSGGWGRERGRVRRGHWGQWRCLPRCGVLLR